MEIVQPHEGTILLRIEEYDTVRTIQMSSATDLALQPPEYWIWRPEISIETCQRSVNG